MLRKISIILLLNNLALAATELSQFGITWTFDRDYQTGQFANGDYWVVGPVTIIDIDPASTDIDDRIINGSMINPSPQNGTTQGYDSMLAARYSNYYSPSLNVARPNSQNLSASNPLIVQPGSSIISSISIAEAPVTPQLRTAAILTVLGSPAPAGSFRPSYSGTDKTIKFNKSQLDYSILSNINPSVQVPTLQQQPGDEQSDSIERMFERPWIDHIPGWHARIQHPLETMPEYGREISTQVGIAALMLNLDFTNQEKETLFIRLVQLGIDNYGIVQDGGLENWENNGGHASGRKFPILLAGLVLHNEGMTNIGQKSGDYLYSNGHGPLNTPADYIHFGEDDQTFYVKEDPTPQEGSEEYDVYVPPYNLHSDNGFSFYGHGDPRKDRDFLEYLQEHIGLPEWGINHVTRPQSDGLDWDADYRRCCTANSWAGWILAVHIMGVKNLWNHDALFDYQDRYMSITAPGGPWPGWRQWSTYGSFTEQMWDAYRADYGGVWVPFDRNDTYSNGEVTGGSGAAAGEKLMTSGNMIIKINGKYVYKEIE